MSLNTKLDISLRDQWAQQHVIRGIQHESNRLAELYNPVGSVAPILRLGKKLPKAPVPPDSGDKVINVVNLGIVGAGAGGLFTAMLLDYLNIQLFKQAGWEDPLKGIKLAEDYPGIPPVDAKFPAVYFRYEIVEAAGSDRVGGRLFSYNFGGARDTHDYYDVGAMRFPDNPVMKRTFDLFNELGMAKQDLTPNAPDGTLIPYYMTNGATPGKEPWCYNDITRWGKGYAEVQKQGTNNDPFEMSTDNSIPSDLLQFSPDDIVKAAIEPLRKALKEDVEADPPGRAGWDLLMKYDTFSTRQFLGVPPPEKLPEDKIPPPPYNYDTIEWLETFNGGTNWYDQAHSETCLESLDFEYDTHTKWYCVLGGAQVIAKKMQEKLWRKPSYDSRVTAIRATAPMATEIDVSSGGSTTTKKFHAVIATPTLGCLRRMDLRKAGLNYATKQAIRSLGYGPSAKVGIKFKRAWWIHDLKKHNIEKAGLGHSDLPLRTCVYPSYNIYDDASKTAVLLCSYSWQQDAQRLGSLMSTDPDHKKKVAAEQALKELLLRDLAILHRNDEQSEEDLYKLISDLYMDHHAWDWSVDPNAAGAFAFFRPQQFSQMWSKMIQPSGDVVLVGEAASPHHAWVVGALESAVHGLHSWMGLNVGRVPAFRDVMKILERQPEEHEKNPYIGLPPYMTPGLSRWHSYLGMLHRSQHLTDLQGDEQGNEAPAELIAKLDLSSFD